MRSTRKPKKQEELNGKINSDLVAPFLLPHAKVPQKTRLLKVDSCHLHLYSLPPLLPWLQQVHSKSSIKIWSFSISLSTLKVREDTKVAMRVSSKTVSFNN